MTILIPILTYEEKKRFYSKITKTENCWIWNGASHVEGYGLFGIKRRLYYTHRIAYFLKHGKINPNLTIDHLCRNRVCVNPDHMEQVTQQENTLRGKTLAAENSKKTHCPRGHPYDIIDKIGHRRCSICLKEKKKIWTRMFRRREPQRSPL